MSYHINPSTGDSGKCSAKPGNCPFGSDDEHYTSPEAARAAFEASQEVNTFHKAMSLKEMNAIAKDVKHPKLINTLIQRGSKQTHANLSKNEHINEQDIRAILALRDDPETRARFFMREDAPLDLLEPEDFAAVAEKAIQADKFSSSPLSNFQWRQNPLSRVAFSENITDAHYDALMASSLTEAQKSRFTPVLAAKNKISGSRVRAYYENNEWRPYPVRPDEALKNGKLSEKDLKEAPDEFIGHFAATGPSPALSSKHVTMLGTAAVARNDRRLAYWVARDSRTHKDKLIEIAKSDLAPEAIMQNQNSPAEALKEVERLHANEPFVRVENLKRTIGKTEFDKLKVKTEGSQLGRAYSETRITYDLAKVKEHGLTKEDMYYIAGARGYNVSVSYDENTGVFAGRVDTSD